MADNPKYLTKNKDADKQIEENVVDNEQLSSEDLQTHQQLTHALHTLDLLNGQLGVAGALLVSFYHLQRQREALATQQVAPQYAPSYPPAPGYPPPPAYSPPMAVSPAPLSQPTYTPPPPTAAYYQPPVSAAYQPNTPPVNPMPSQPQPNPQPINQPFTNSNPTDQPK